MRTIQDANLDSWEVYASSGEFGFPDRSKIVFQNLSDRLRRARFVALSGDKADAEHEIATSADDALARLLAEATELK